MLAVAPNSRKVGGAAVSNPRGGNLRSLDANNDDIVMMQDYFEALFAKNTTTPLVSGRDDPSNILKDV